MTDLEHPLCKLCEKCKGTVQREFDWQTTSFNRNESESEVIDTFHFCQGCHLILGFRNILGKIALFFGGFFFLALILVAVFTSFYLLMEVFLSGKAETTWEIPLYIVIGASIGAWVGRELGFYFQSILSTPRKIRKEKGRGYYSEGSEKIEEDYQVIIFNRLDRSQAKELVIEVYK